MQHFFAPFFERTARDMAVRGGMLAALHSGDLDLDNLVTAVKRSLRNSGLRLYAPGVETGAARRHQRGNFV